MQKLISLLNKTRLITSRVKYQLIEKEERGENFNIFEILKLSSYEEKLHTPFIAELLSPKGSHGLKEAFFRAFLEQTQIKINFDYKTISVKTEFSIGYNSEDYTQGGRIDILIIDKQKNAIIIENKIYADDQKNQILRYSNYAKSNKLKCILLYLTLEGKQAQNKSLGNKDIDYKCISYRETILKWLERCLELSVCHPIVRETIRQYITNIKILLNIMDSDNLNDIIKITTSPEYIESTLDIISNRYKIEEQIRKDFILSLADIAKRNNLELKYYNEIHLLNDNSFIAFYSPKISEKWGIFIGADKHTKKDGVFYGISQLEENKPHITKKQLEKINPFWEKYEQSSSYPLGWDYLRGDNNTWWNWSDIGTLKDMANGKIAQYIENEIIKPILKNKLLQKIEKITTI